MKRIVCVLAVWMLLWACCVCNAEDTEYPVFYGVKWGDSVDSVRSLLGYVREHDIFGVITTLEYKNQKFGNDDVSYTLYFNENGLYSITTTIIDTDNPDLLPEIYIEAFLNAYGEPTMTNIENAMAGGCEKVENGDYYCWNVNTNTGLYVHTARGLVDITFTKLKILE